MRLCAAMRAWQGVLIGAVPVPWRNAGKMGVVASAGLVVWGRLA